MKIQELSERLNFIQLNNCYYRNFGSITGSLVEVDINVKCPAVSFYFDKPFSKEELKELRKNASKNLIYHNNYCKGFLLTLTLPYSLSVNDKYVEKCENVINTFVSYMNSQNYQTSTKCVVCGEEAENGSFGGIYVPVHSECVDSLKELSKQEVAEENKNIANLPKSIILAFVGAIVGLIPSVISILGFGTMIALLYALIPLASFFGYKLGKAPKRWYATLIVIVLSVFVVVALDIYLYDLIAFSEGITLAECLSLYSADFVSDLLYSVLFVGVGVFISWKYISNTADTRKNNANKL